VKHLYRWLQVALPDIPRTFLLLCKIPNFTAATFRRLLVAARSIYVSHNILQAHFISPLKKEVCYVQLLSLVQKAIYFGTDVYTTAISYGSRNKEYIPKDLFYV